MINLTNIKKWHDALVSGYYEQGTGTLVRDSRYCCLGVACHEAIKDGVTVLVEVDDGEEYGFELINRDFSYTETDALPPEVRKWLGLSIGEADPELLTKEGAFVAAASLNDDRGYTFTQIAECIVRTWPEAFESTNEVTS
jgi:hypothetical protein